MTFIIVINGNYMLSVTVQKIAFKNKIGLQKGSVYTQRAMVPASLHSYTCQVNNFDLLGP